MVLSIDLTKNLPENTFRDETFEFIRSTVAWISGKDNMDKCFVLNFGYEAPIPWPQVQIYNTCLLTDT